MEKQTINNDLNVPHQMALPIKKMRIKYVKNVINIKSTQQRLRAATW